MLFVKTNDLKPGMRIARPIYNKLGVLLYERDTRLSATGIENIKNFELIGIYILEPAEPVPPLSDEDIAFEQFQTIAMFQIRKCMELIIDDKIPTNLRDLIQTIVVKYGYLDHKLNFMQNLRSTSDYVYKHVISTAILTSMLAHCLSLTPAAQEACVTAALLYDFGWLYVPMEIREKGKNLSANDQMIIANCKKVAYDKISEREHEYAFSINTMKIISQMLFVSNPANSNNSEKISRMTETKILQVADTFDRMTAMNLDEPPASELTAIRYLFDHPEIYDPQIVSALSTCINILPMGCCVDMTTNEKAMVIDENPEHFMQPIVLNFSNNRVYNLGDTETYREMQIRDIMKTMDNRILIDENTLNLFVADDNLKAVTKRFHQQKSMPKPSSAPKTESAEKADSGPKAMTAPKALDGMSMELPFDLYEDNSDIVTKPLFEEPKREETVAATAAKPKRKKLL